MSWEKPARVCQEPKGLVGVWRGGEGGGTVVYYDGDVGVVSVGWVGVGGGGSAGGVGGSVADGVELWGRFRRWETRGAGGGEGHCGGRGGYRGGGGYIMGLVKERRW